MFGAVLILGAASNASAQQIFEVDRADDADISGCTSAPDDCTLRGAIRRANESSESFTEIHFRIPVNVVREIILVNGSLSVTKEGQLTIYGADIKISGNNQSRVFTNGSSSSLRIFGATISGGSSYTGNQQGGAIYNAGELGIYDSIIENNSSGSSGGGIYNEGTLTVSDSTVRNNSALTSGGGIYNTNGTVSVKGSTINNNSSGSSGGSGGGIANSNGTFNVVNSTIYGNEGNNGGGIGSSGAFTLIDSTVGNNRADGATGVGGGVLNSGSGTFDSRNSIIAGNFAPNGADFSGALNSLGYNLIQNTALTTINGNTAGNILGQAPLFDPRGLQNNGGDTQTVALLPNSPAVDAADPENFRSIDQRGKRRPADGDNNGAALPDIGAFELTRTLIVTKTADTNDGVCASDCSLREAIADANSTSSEKIISFDPAVFGSSPQTITLAGGSDLLIRNSGELTINGTGMDLLTISLNTASFNVQGTMTINDLTVKDGSGTDGGCFLNRGITTLNRITLGNCRASLSGGGIFSSGTLNINNSIFRDNFAADSGGGIFSDGTLNISNSSLSGNSAQSEGGAIRSIRFTMINSVVNNNTARDGGGILIVNYGAATLIQNSTIDGNQSGFGGGIASFGNLDIYSSTISRNTSTDGAGGIFYRGGTFTLINSTVSGNSAAGDGGGINNRGIFNLIHSTIARNTASSGGGIINLGGTVNAANSIIADNSSEDFYGELKSNGYNLVENAANATFVINAPGGVITGQDPQLLPLGNYGGSTKLHVPRLTSPAIDAGRFTGLLTASVDQRARVRPIDFPTIANSPEGDGSDLGSFERRETDLGSQTFFDFDGDSKTDISIFRPTAGEWWYLRSSDLSNRAFAFGSSSDKLVPADYTGDGKTDVAFWRESTGEWFILRSEDSSFYSFPFGSLGDIPAPADFDGDGRADPAVFRPSNATWYIVNSSDNSTTIAQFGASGDLPVAADYDGDSKADLAVFRPSDGSWWLNRTQAGLIVTNFGSSSDKTVQADYTGDGKADVAFFRPSSGEWFILRSEDFSFYSFPFGASGDIPSPGDYDGDGRTDPAVFRNSAATWYLLRSTSGFTALGFGASGDIPVPSAFVR